MGWAGLLPGTFYPLILNLLKDGLSRIAAGIIYPLTLNYLSAHPELVEGWFGLARFPAGPYRHSRVSGNPAPAGIRFCPAPLPAG